MTGQFNIVRNPAPTKERDFLFSIGNALKLAERMKFGARDVDGTLISESFEVRNKFVKTPTDIELTEEYAKVQDVRQDENEISFARYKALRDPRVATTVFKRIIRSMGIVDEGDLRFDDTLIGAEDGE